MDLCSHKHDFGISAEWMLFATSYYKSPVLDYKAILDLCENEMMSIKFFWNLEGEDDQCSNCD